MATVNTCMKLVTTQLKILPPYLKNSYLFGQVMITLEGSNGESETHHLTDPDQPVFEKGGVDMFMLSTPSPLGELLSIKLWHDNTGGHPDW